MSSFEKKNRKNPQWLFEILSNSLIKNSKNSLQYLMIVNWFDRMPHKYKYSYLRLVSKEFLNIWEWRLNYLLNSILFKITSISDYVIWGQKWNDRTFCFSVRNNWNKWQLFSHGLAANLTKQQVLAQKRS